MRYEYRYKKETKVKVCLPDNKEIIGTIKEVNRTNISIKHKIDKKLANTLGVYLFNLNVNGLNI